MRRGLVALAATTASMRFSTAILQAATPLLLASFGFGLTGVAALTVILWAAVTAGSLSAALVREARLTSLLGLAAMASGLLLLYLSRGPSPLALVAVPLSGFGAGLASPSLAPALHKMSSEGRPFEGVASYSLSLSIGLVAAMAYTSLASLRGLPLAFLGASAVSAAVAVLLAASGVDFPSVRVDLPTASDALKLFMNPSFLRAFTSNFSYSLVFPLVISYWALYATRVIGLKPDMAFAAIASMFLISATIRGASVNVRDVAKAHRIAEASLLLAVALLSTRQELLVIAGLLLFAVPHSLVYPSTLYMALTSSEHQVKANYVYSISSGAGEVLSPVVAALVIRWAGLGPLYLAAMPFAVASFISAFV
ncbi:MAG: hypothetical protein ACP5FT_04150 [Acidilobus sp.]